MDGCHVVFSPFIVRLRGFYLQRLDALPITIADQTSSLTVACRSIPINQNQFR
jgi:hypothetical protein